MTEHDGATERDVDLDTLVDLAHREHWRIFEIANLARAARDDPS